MPLETHSREIGPYTYNVTTLDAVKGRTLFVRLSNAAAPILNDVHSEADFVKNLLGALSEKDLSFFCDTFGAATSVTGGSYEDRSPQLMGKVFMEHFAGDYLAMFEWLAFCVEVNFRNFFSGIKPALERVKANFAPAEVKKPE